LELDGDAAVVSGRNNAPPLYMVAALVPHHPMWVGAAAARCSIVLSYDGKEECLGGDNYMQQLVKEWSDQIKAIVDCVVGQPQPMDYDVSYFAPHGLARITLRKASNELAWTMETRSGAAKRKRPHLWQAFSLSLYICTSIHSICSVIIVIVTVGRADLFWASYDLIF
jgi:hypothetical protein